MSVHRPAQTHGPTWRRYIDAESLRDATRRVVNATLAVRDPRIWGDGTTACASDSKHFGAFDQNLMTEWHIRYGGRGVMIYWHVERGSVCIHSRLRRCSSSEVAAMIEGVLRHDTEMEVERQYVDSHGQSEVAFAFCRMLGFHLLPRLKAISAQRLYLPDAGGVAAYPNLARILARQLDWALVGATVRRVRALHDCHGRAHGRPALRGAVAVSADGQNAQLRSHWASWVGAPETADEASEAEPALAGAALSGDDLARAA